MDHTEKPKSVAWYKSDIGSKITPQLRKLLEEYSNVAPSEVVNHIQEIRDKAWDITGYPCTGLGLFLSPMLPKLPIYESIIKRLQAGDSFLDVGCFIGHDLRRLTFDGAPSNRLYAVDIVSHWDVGYEMFFDKDKFSAHFIKSDIRDPVPELQALRGSIDIISIIHVLHQWNWDDQIRIAKQLCELSRPGSMVVGFQVGGISAWQKPPQPYNRDSPPFIHNPKSFQKMWSQVSRETGTEWLSTSCLKTWEEVGWDPKDAEYLGENARIIEFVVTRED